jgi:hypothetical protein
MISIITVTNSMVPAGGVAAASPDGAELGGPSAPTPTSS